MNKNSTLIGILIGFALCYYFFKPAPEKKAKTEVVEQAEVDTAEAAPIKIKRKNKINADHTPRRKIAKAFTTATEEPSITPPLDTVIQKTIAVKKPPQKRTGEVTLSEQTVINLESQLSYLDEQSLMTQEERGWRVKLLTPNSILAQAGLHVGDLITYDSLQALNQTNASLNLAYRMETVLNHISR